MHRENWFILSTFGYVAWLTLCAADRGTYGDNCNRTNRCDSQSSLSCIEDKCQCVKLIEMVYDENAKKCRILSGEKCSFTIVESRTDAFEETRVTELFDCVENANCQNEYCSCLPDWYEDTQGVCRSKKLNGEQCNSNNECREDLQLKCENGVCSCDRTEAVFNGQCAAKVGVSCAKNGICVPNAFCSHYDQICTCKSGYENSTNGFCLGKYGMYCDANVSPCIETFSCLDRSCGCHFPQHQQYDNDGHCVSYPQGPCLEYVNGIAMKFPCTSNAECKTQDRISECICSDGYIHSDDRQCYLAHGQPCFESKSCDPLASLVCRNGRCACQDLQIYDETRSLCIGLVGAKCRMNEHFCHAGASCQSSRFNSRDGTCRCSENHVSSSKRKCVRRESYAEGEDLLLEVFEEN